MFEARGETYKVEIIRSIPAGEEISLFQHGDFIDLCRGPARRAHRARSRPSRCSRSPAPTGAATSATRCSSGSTAPPSPRRRSWTSTWPRLEEAKQPRPPHAGQAARSVFVRRPGRARASCSGTPRAPSSATRSRRSSGARTCAAATSWSTRRTWRASSCSPPRATSTHYKENLFGGMELEGQRYLVKPMNCPFHVAIYRSQLRSYRELPIRYSELGTVYRYERSGVLHGLLRVRGLTMDDGHLFVREDQIGDEMGACLTFSLALLKLFGFADYNLYLATRPESFMGEPAAWDARRGGAAQGDGGDRSPVRGGRGRGRVLRAQDRSQDQGRPRPRVAVRDLPARLPAAPAVRPGVRGQPTASATGRS